MPLGTLTRHVTGIGTATGISCAVGAACGGPRGAPTTPSTGTTPPPSDRVIYSSSNLAGHTVAAECNPGDATQCLCSDADAGLSSSAGFGEVTSNVTGRQTYVNAIGHRKFLETLPDGQSLDLAVYRYSGYFQLPTLPKADVTQRSNPQAIHAMIQLWDGRNKLFQSGRRTLEGTIYYDVNPWGLDYGKIKIYRDPVELIDSGLRLVPDTAWHAFELVVDLARNTYVRIAIDDQMKDLRDVPLARVAQPSWGTEVALTITTESLAAWPQPGCTLVFTWTTRFRDVRLDRLGGGTDPDSV